MINLELWKNKKEIRHVELNENEVLCALTSYLYTVGYIDFEDNWQVDIESITR